jgi:hypothetical protein
MGMSEKLAVPISPMDLNRSGNLGAGGNTLTRLACARTLSRERERG